MRWTPSGDEGVVDAVLPRNVLFRQDALRTKVFAANLDQVLVLLAAEPTLPNPREACADRSPATGIEQLIALNKRDVQPAFAEAWMASGATRHGRNRAAAATARDDASADADLAALTERLRGRVTLVMGASGVDRAPWSTGWCPMRRPTPRPFRARWGPAGTRPPNEQYWLDDGHGGALIDSPGFHEFGLHHIAPEALARWMPDLAPYVGQCRFHNCTHRREPGCAIQAAIAPHEADRPPHRWRMYQDLYEEFSAARTLSAWPRP